MYLSLLTAKWLDETWGWSPFNPVITIGVFVMAFLHDFTYNYCHDCGEPYEADLPSFPSHLRYREILKFCVVLKMEKNIV